MVQPPHSRPRMHHRLRRIIRDPAPQSGLQPSHRRGTSSAHRGDAKKPTHAAQTSRRREVPAVP